MARFRVVGGSWTAGAGAYEAGLFTMPDGSVRGIEDLVSLTTAGDAPADPHWADQIVGGLRSALASTVRLPLPLDLAASTVRAGLDALGEGLHRRATMEARFADGSSLVAVVEAGTVSLVRNDRAVILLAQARGALPGAAAGVPAELPGSAPPEGGAIRAGEAGAEAADAALTSIFEYEKRGGRLRRVPAAQGPRKNA